MVCIIFLPRISAWHVSLTLGDIIWPFDWNSLSHIPSPSLYIFVVPWEWQVSQGFLWIFSPFFYPSYFHHHPFFYKINGIGERGMRKTSDAKRKGRMISGLDFLDFFLKYESSKALDDIMKSGHWGKWDLKFEVLCRKWLKIINYAFPHSILWPFPLFSISNLHLL